MRSSAKRCNGISSDSLRREEVRTGKGGHSSRAETIAEGLRLAMVLTGI